jgi:hypothetical protein
MDTRAWRILLMAISACLAVVLASAIPAAGATHPTVVSGTHAANITIPTGPLTEMVSLPLPAGRWFVMAKAMVTGVADDIGTYSVNCRLSAGGDFDVALVAPMHSGGPNSRLPIVLTVVHHFQAPGEAALACSAHVSGSAVIGLITVQAMKVGTLTNGPIGSVGATSGTGTPQVISAFRDVAIFTNKDDWSAPQDLPLFQGKWLIIAKASVSGAASGNIVSQIQCRVVGMTGSNVLFGDLVLGNLTPVGLPGSRMVMGVQTAGNIGPAGGFARFECNSMFSGHGFSWLKITAIKLGKLTKRNLDTGTTTASGSGSPRLIHGTLDSGGTVSIPKTYTTIAQVPLPAGKWLVTGKLTIVAEGGTDPVRVDCRVVGSKTDEGRFLLTSGFNRGPFWFQVVHSANSTANLRLQCKRVGSGWSFNVFLVRLSALRVGTLTNLAL